ncbi:MAG: acyl carrier protein [Verrucomicrobiota bacterium]
MPAYSEIEALIIDTVTLLAKDFEIESLDSVTAESPLYGNGGPLDSMGLVNLIADLEDAVYEKFEASITLADEKAMSAHKSPFLNVRSLSNAVQERLMS